MFNNIFRESDNAYGRLKQQIDTLKIFNANVTEVVKDEEYKVDFGSGGRTVSLIVRLGPEFPLEKPSLYIYPPVRHPWVSPTGEIVSAPGLLNFTVHSDLGRVVQAIIREFQLRPPQLLNGDISPPQFDASKLPTPSTHSNYIYSDKNYNTSAGVSSSFPALNEMSTAQLKELNENSDLLNSFIDNLNVKLQISKSISEYVELNEKLADENLKKEPELVELQDDVSTLLVTLKEYKSKYEELSAEYKDCCDRFNPHQIIQRIREKVSEVDEESERIAEAFLTGDMDLDTFLLEYVSHRTLSHSRKIKDEKLSQQLEKLHQAGY
ncbi:vacuolar protein sorting-associated protein 37A [Halyomorpha halys]|uniref:vacuolar protein sorting-associated protein 37A n=1 Tax=Halyomorpha halys TaxID=286706 RepID=UPI0006D5196B|nr:vacuolar protein sorting-associated protein 37A-like [Halyomorpha halys]